MSGLALLKIVRHDDRYINLPYFLTDSAFTRAKVIDAGRAGVTGLIVTPYKVETLKQKIDTMSKVTEVCVPEEVRHYFPEGMKLLEDEKYEKALEVFEKMLTQGESPEIYYNIGYIKTVKEEDNEAIDAFRKATKLDRYFAKAYEGMGRAYKALGKGEAAAERLRKAAESYMSNEKEEEARGSRTRSWRRTPTPSMSTTRWVFSTGREATIRQPDGAASMWAGRPARAGMTAEAICLIIPYAQGGISHDNTTGLFRSLASSRTGRFRGIRIRVE